MSKRGLMMAVALAAGLVILGSFVAVGDQECCEKPDPEYQALLASAQTGDPKSIRELYRQAEADRVAPMAEHWAYRGALAGDRAMRLAYVEIFRSRIDSQRQQKVIASLEASTMPGAACLLAQLRGTGPMPAHCS